MTRRTPLNETQLKALRWIADGCPDGVWSGHAHKTTCYALHDRGLADVDRRRESWSATISDDGRHYLEHGSYPEMELEDIKERSANARPWDATVGEPRPSAAEVAGAIMQRVDAEGGAVDLGDMGYGFDARSVEGAAARSPWRPHGKTLRLHARGGWANRRIHASFEDDLSVEVERAGVPVPLRVTRWHPAAAAFRADPERQEVTKNSLARASRIVQALGTECDRRGHDMRWSEQVGQHHQDFRRALTRGQFSITIDRFTFDVRIREIAGKGGQPRDYRDRAALPAWLANRTHTFMPTGRLELRAADYPRDGRPAAFRDGKRAALEGSLPTALWELEVRALEDARTAEKRQREANFKRERWKAAMESAEQQLVESHRHDELARQAAAWAEHLRLERYVHAMRERLRTLDDADDADGLADWIAWAEGHTAATAPFAETPHAPNDPTPTAESMQPFLGGWTFYPPELTMSLRTGDGSRRAAGGEQPLANRARHVRACGFLARATSAQVVMRNDRRSSSAGDTPSRSATNLSCFISSGSNRTPT